MATLEEIYAKSIECGYIKKEIATNIRQSSVAIYLEKIYDNVYPNWKFELIQFGAEYFINTTTHIHKNNQLIIDSINALKLLKYKDFGTLKYEFEAIVDLKEELPPVTQEERKELILRKIHSNKEDISYYKFFTLPKEQQKEYLQCICEIPQDNMDENQYRIYKQSERIGLLE